MTVKITPTHFKGGSEIYRVDQNGLTPVIRALLQDVSKIAAAAVTGLTDNSAGAAADGVIGVIPAVTPAQVNQGDYATGSITVAINPAADETFTLNGTVFTMKASGAAGAQVNIGGTAALTAAAIVTVLNASVNAEVAKATYANPSGALITIVSDTYGTAMNAWTVATNAPTKFTVSGATLSGGVAEVGVQAAATDSALVTVRSAIGELIAQCSAIAAKVPVFSALTDSTGSVAADGTIGAVTKTFTAVDTSFANATTLNTVLTAYKSRIAQLAVHVNQLCVACGVEGAEDNSGGEPVYSNTYAALAVTVGAVVTGVSSAAAYGGCSKTEGDASFAAMAAAVKELATALNRCTLATTGYLVPHAVAVSA